MSQLMAYAAGTPRQIDHEAAIHTRKQVGYELAGWFQFQPIFDQDLQGQPRHRRLSRHAPHRVQPIRAGAR